MIRYRPAATSDRSYLSPWVHAADDSLHGWTRPVSADRFRDGDRYKYASTAPGF